MLRLLQCCESVKRKRRCGGNAQAAEDITMLEMQHLVDKVCEEMGMARMQPRKGKGQFDDGMDV